MINTLATHISCLCKSSRKMLMEFNQHLFDIKLLFCEAQPLLTNFVYMIDSQIKEERSLRFASYMRCRSSGFSLFFGGRHALLNCQYSANRKVSGFLRWCGIPKKQRPGALSLLLGVRAHSCSLRTRLFYSSEHTI
jgi:hypothetical protein